MILLKVCTWYLFFSVRNDNVMVLGLQSASDGFGPCQVLLLLMVMT